MSRTLKIILAIIVVIALVYLMWQWVVAIGVWG